MNKPNHSSVYICLLGSHPDLSWIELQKISKLTLNSLDRFDEHYAQIKTDLDPKKLLNRSGGLVKIWQITTTLKKQSKKIDLEHELAKILIEIGKKKITFSVAEIGKNNQQPIDLFKIKNYLKASGIKSRFLNGPRTGLSAAILTHRPVEEIAVIRREKEVAFAKIAAIQNIDQWTIRDRGKPFAQHKRGLLPPKIARIMINLALPELKEGGVIYDPFCGSGTILLEALNMGYQVMGSDIDIEAVEGTRTNLNWLIKSQTKPNINSNFTIFTSDATRVKLTFKPDAIVTEPFLGKPKPKEKDFANILKGLVKLYLGTLKNLVNQLDPQTPIIMIFPQFRGKKTISLFDKLIDKLEPIGYTTLPKPLTYSRPGAVVERQIIKLKVK